MQIEKFYIGGWFQRTTLHLSEIYDFLKKAYSPLELNAQKLKRLQNNLQLTNVELVVGKLEYIKISTRGKIGVKIYEDGLIVLCKNPDREAKSDIDKLKKYYEKLLSPALNYIFSLGAPVPKELANIENIYPYFLILNNVGQIEIEKLLNNFEQEKYFEIIKESFQIYRGNKLYIINNISEPFPNIEKFIEEQIFVREFKGQMHRYLNLHRIIWEKIAAVKEKGEIKGKDIDLFTRKAQSYSKTIDLIDARINQMGSYIHTRETITKENKEFAQFADVLQFKYETLINTLDYMKEIWGMTKNYVNSAIDLFSNLQAMSTEASVRTLTVVTSMGVGASLIGLFAQKELPEFSLFGVGYFLVLALIGYTANKLVKLIYARRNYKIKDIGITKDI